MKRSKRLISLLVALSMVASMFTVTAYGADKTTFADVGVDSNDIVILHTNDVHGGVSDFEALTGTPASLGYAGLAAIEADAKGIVGNDNVTLVDVGDTIQGSVITTESNGQDLIDVMEKIGVDINVPGNHEFDYGVQEFLDMVAASSLNYLCANFTDMEGNLVLDKAYDIFTYNVNGQTIDVAYIGLDTPASIAQGTPAHFQDADGNFIYTFNEDTLHELLQTKVDEVKAAGAEYVIVVGHMGEDAIVDSWGSLNIIANTTGIDVFIDGHAHSVIEHQVVENKDGEDVILTSAGDKLEYVGVLKLDVAADGTITTTSKLINAVTDAQKESTAYKEMDAYVDTIENKYAYLVEVVATSEYDLMTSYNTDSSMADFLTDAFRWYATYDERCVPADIAFMNAGSIRANIPAGDITVTNLMTVMPWSSQMVEIRVTGQQIVDALELGVKGETVGSGGFMTGSNLEYTINMNKASKVVVDSLGMFVKVDGTYEGGDYRVQDVKIGGKPVELTKSYTCIISSYYYDYSGDGMTMFKTAEEIVGAEENMIDVDIVKAYLQVALGGEVSDAYDNPKGDGRIKTISKVELAETTTSDAALNALKNKNEEITAEDAFAYDMTKVVGTKNNDGRYLYVLAWEELPAALAEKYEEKTFYAVLGDGTEITMEKSDKGLVIATEANEGTLVLAVKYVVGGVDTGDYSTITVASVVMVMAASMLVFFKKKKENY